MLKPSVQSAVQEGNSASRPYCPTHSKRQTFAPVLPLHFSLPARLVTSRFFPFFSFFPQNPPSATHREFASQRETARRNAPSLFIALPNWTGQLSSSVIRSSLCPSFSGCQRHHHRCSSFRDLSWGNSAFSSSADEFPSQNIQSSPGRALSHPFSRAIGEIHQNRLRFLG